MNSWSVADATLRRRPAQLIVVATSDLNAARGLRDASFARSFRFAFSERLQRWVVQGLACPHQARGMRRQRHSLLLIVGPPQKRMRFSAITHGQTRTDQYRLLATRLFRRHNDALRDDDRGRATR